MAGGQYGLLWVVAPLATVWVNVLMLLLQYLCSIPQALPESNEAHPLIQYNTVVLNFSLHFHAPMQSHQRPSLESLRRTEGLVLSAHVPAAAPLQRLE